MAPGNESPSSALAAECNDLVENGLGIAHAAVGSAGDGGEGAVVDGDFFRCGNVAETRSDQADGDAFKVEPLTAGNDCGQNFMRFGGGKEKFDVRRRFFKGLEQCVPGGVGQHVDFVDNVDLEPASGGCVLDVVAQVADVLDLVVGGAVNFDDIQRISRGDLAAGFAFATGFGDNAGFAVQRFCEDPGGRGFPDAARADEQVGMADALLGDGVLQGARDVFLSDDFIEPLRSPLSCKYFVGHEFRVRSLEFRVEGTNSEC
jgi:hypothetical protein